MGNTVVHFDIFYNPIKPEWLTRRARLDAMSFDWKTLGGTKLTSQRNGGIMQVLNTLNSEYFGFKIRQVILVIKFGQVWLVANLV